MSQIRPFERPRRLWLLLLLSAARQNYNYNLLSPARQNYNYKKVIYNIGTEILMLKRNLHNSTLRGRTKLIFSRIAYSSWRSIRWRGSQPGSNFKQKCSLTNVKKWILAAGSVISWSFCTQKLNMTIRPIISMKSTCSCVFLWSQALKTIILMSF